MHNRFLWCEVLPAPGVVDVQPILRWVQANAAAGLRSVIGLSPKTDRGYPAPDRGSCTADSDGSPSWMLAPGSIYEPLQNGEGADAHFHLNYRNPQVQAQLRFLLITLRQEMARLDPPVLASIDSFELDIGHDGELDAARNYDTYPPGAPLGWMDADMYRCIYAGFTWNKARDAQTCTDGSSKRVAPDKAWGAIDVWRDQVIKPIVDIYGQELSTAAQGDALGRPIALMIVGQLVSADERSAPCAGCGGLNVVDYAWQTYGIGAKTTGVNTDLGNGNGEDKLNAEYRNWANILKLNWPSRFIVGEHGANSIGSGHCCDDEQEMYWATLNALDKHVQQWHFPVSHFAQSAPGFRAAQRLVARYARQTVQTTPDIWIVFRDTEGDYYPDGANNQPQGKPAGRQPCCRWLPNYEWFLYQNNPLSEQVVQRGLPATPAYLSLSARSTQSGPLQLDVEDIWPGATQTPQAAGGCAVYQVEVTYADQGADSFALRYATAAGGVVEKQIAKTDTGTWQTASWQLDDAVFANRLAGGADLELVNSAGPPDIFHRVGIELRTACPAMPSPTETASLLPPPATPAPPPATPTPFAAVVARIVAVTPRTDTPLARTTRADITAYLYRDEARNPVPCAYNPTVRLWQATNTQVARFVKLGEKDMLTVDGQTFPVWTFTDVDVSLARNSRNRLNFFVTVDGVATRHNIWTYGQSQQSLWPAIDLPTRSCQ
jgi:hypothetical protein